jgi:phage-related minor tail protein
MAGYIRGITIEFGADTSKLNGALKKTQGTINKTQAELKQINRALKFNPGNTTLLRQKFELLQQSVNETRTKLKQLKDMQKKMDASGVDKTSAQYRELEREIVKTENQVKKAEGALKEFGSVGKQQALAVGNAFKSAGGKISSAGKSITTSVSVYGMAGIYTGAKLIEMSEKQTQAENKLAEIYKSRMGVGKKAVKSTLQLASAQQKAGVVGDEVQLAAAQQLATYAKYPGTVNTMLPALNDLLVQQKGLNGTQEDATNLANLFGKAMMGQTGALKRAGISFTEAQEEVLKY